ncbi:MAG: LPPG--FO 2-phospho-L-lactate transferase [Thermodesulfobacteriota bacterium]|nr:MAG: LPPG--FO 2-phospho-L-lactate transferase [Thermodesulfobacteriota bacterium]
MLTALGGGVGAAKFLEGLSNVIGNEQLNVIVNTGDDIKLGGLNISPDVDTIIYRLSGVVDRKKGWGLEGDTFNFLNSLKRFGLETWFNIGDQDIATHIYRTHLKSKGFSATQIASRIAKAFGLADNISVLPMTDHDVETWIQTNEGEMHFQEYLVKKKMKPEVCRVTVRDIDQASAAPGVVDSIENARAIIVCPSNPIISIGPILQVKGIRDALKKTKAQVIAISPLVGGVPLKGPADRLMRGLGLEVSSAQIARLYSEFLDTMVIDLEDAHENQAIVDLGLKTLVVDTVMSDKEKASILASSVLELI